MNKALIIVDMINGFVTKGALADPKINHITKEIKRLTKAYIADGNKIIAFKDAHALNCMEFKSFPPHCVKGTWESDMVDELKDLESKMQVFEKNSTSGFVVPEFLKSIKGITEIVITGCCTDICILNLAIPLKNYFNQHDQDVKIIVPKNAVDTYHIPSVHDRDEWNTMAFRFMQQAGVQIVDEVK